MRVRGGAAAIGEPAAGLTPVEAAWIAVRDMLRKTLGARSFDGWLKPVGLETFDEDSGTVVLNAPSDFMANWVTTHFADQAPAGLAGGAAVGPRHSVVARGGGLALASFGADLAPVDSAPPAEVVTERLRWRRSGQRSSRATPSTRSWSEGQRGRLQRRAHARAGRAADLQPAVPPWRHRARQDPPDACARPRLSARHPGARVIYMSAEKFMFEFVSAMRAKDTLSFKARLRSGRRADDRRRPVHRGQGFDPGRILPHDERDHLGRRG
jgi:chromosomal replication initiator protein